MVCSLEALRGISEKQLQLLSAGALYIVLLGFIPIGISLTAYVLFYTSYWYVALAYLFWIWVIDADTPQGVGRPNNWVRNWTVFKYASRYFPVKLHTQPGVKLDKNLNYLACGFPHGIMPTGIMVGFLTNGLSDKPFPDHDLYGIMLNGLFYIPIFRDVILSLGLCSSNAASIKRVLSRPNGGIIAGIIPGGAVEMFYSSGGVHKIVLNNRKGFVKIAIRMGSPIIPMYTFGETNIYKQKVFPEGSRMRRIQEWLRVRIGFPPVIFYGRGIFNGSIGIIPLQCPINVVVGTPIEVTKTENPTIEEINNVHSQFVDALKELFEKYKYQFEPNPEESQLIIL